MKKLVSDIPLVSLPYVHTISTVTMPLFKSDKLHTAAVVRHTNQQRLCRETLDNLWNQHGISEFLAEWNEFTDFPTERDQAAWCLENFLKIVDALMNEEVEYGFLPQLRWIVRVYWGRFYEHYIFDDFSNQDDMREFEELVSTFKAQYQAGLDCGGAFKIPHPWKRADGHEETKCFEWKPLFDAFRNLKDVEFKPLAQSIPLKDVKKRSLGKWRRFRRRWVPRSVRYFWYDHFC